MGRGGNLAEVCKSTRQDSSEKQPLMKELASAGLPKEEMREGEKKPPNKSIKIKSQITPQRIPIKKIGPNGRLESSLFYLAVIFAADGQQ